MQEVRHGQARHVVGEVEAAVLEVGVADIRLIQFEIVTKGEMVLSLGPAEHVADIAGIPDKFGVSEAAEGEVAGDCEAADAGLPLWAIARCLNRRSSYPEPGLRGRLAGRDPRPSEQRQE